MELRIVNPDPKYPKVDLAAPTPLGYVCIAATVRPGPLPVVLPSAKRARLLRKLKRLTLELDRVDGVIRTTVFRAIAIPPTDRISRYLRERKSSIRTPRFDVLVLVETTSPDRTREVQKSAAYNAIIDAIQREAERVHVVAARNSKRIADVDEKRQGLFLFNHFVADDTRSGLELWEYLASWFKKETGLDNSLLLVPLEGERSDYSFINEARWDVRFPRYLWRQFTKKSFRDFVLANLEANRVGSMPVFYRLAYSR